MDKTVILITPGFAADENDTSSVPYLQDYIIALIHHIGAEKVKIIALHYPFTKKKYTWNGAAVVPLNGKNKKGLLRLLLFSKAVSTIKKIIRHGNCVIHSFWLTDAAFIGGYISKKYRQPHITTIMGQDAKEDNKFLQLFDFTKMTTVALSQNHANVFRMSTNKNPDHIIPFGINPADSQKIKTHRTQDLLFVGSFIVLKHPEIFLEIVKLIKNDLPDVSAVMAGDGPLLAEIKQIAKEMGLEHQVRFTGMIGREKVFEEMGNAKILVHPSEYEGQSVVYAEALAYGMYVLSFNVGYIEQVSRHIVCDSVNDMAIQAYKLLTSASDYTSIQQTTNNDTAEKYLQIYETINSPI